MISALIVTYNSERCIGACLESLRWQEPKAGLEIVVVDNGSQDATVEVVRRFPDVKLIASPGNLGFAAAVNRAARQASGDALLILNPDTICRSGLEPLEKTLHGSEKIVAVAPRLVDSRGEFQRGFAIRRLPTRAALLFEILLLPCFPWESCQPPLPLPGFQLQGYDRGGTAGGSLPAGAALEF